MGLYQVKYQACSLRFYSFTVFALKVGEGSYLLYGSPRMSGHDQNLTSTIPNQIVFSNCNFILYSF